MHFNRNEMKSCARENIAGLRPYFLLPGTIYTAIVYLLSQIAARLSGYTDYLLSYTAMTQDVLLNNVEPYPVDWVTPAPVAAVLCFAVLLMALILKVGFMWYCLGLSRQKEMKVKYLFDSFYYFLKVGCLELIKTLLYAVSFLLLFFPLLLLLYRYCFAEYILHDHPDYSIFRCLRESAKLTKGHRRELFVLDLSLLGWYILRSLLFIATAYVTPYEYATKCEYYNRISGRKPEEKENNASLED